MLKLIHPPTLLLLATATAALGGGGQIEARTFNPSEGRQLLYRIFKPSPLDANRKYPLVLCLHGAGGRGDDNMSRGVQAFITLSSPEVQSVHPAFLMTPQCPLGNSWVSILFKRKEKGSYTIEESPESELLVMTLAVIDNLMREFPIDPDRVYVTGQSMGGFGTWDLILRHPERFAAAVPICGAGDPGKAARIAHLPIWAFHGENDTMVPAQGSREMMAALKAAGSTVAKYTEYPGGGHGTWVPAWTREKELIPWLFSQSRKVSK